LTPPTTPEVYATIPVGFPRYTSTYVSSMFFNGAGIPVSVAEVGFRKLLSQVKPTTDTNHYPIQLYTGHTGRSELYAPTVVGVVSSKSCAQHLRCTQSLRRETHQHLRGYHGTRGLWDGRQEVVRYMRCGECFSGGMSTRRTGGRTGRGLWC
jgi:hypothetical protein